MATCKPCGPPRVPPLPSDSKFCVRAIKGCGFGLVATTTISPGERLLVEKPLFLIPGPAALAAKSKGRGAEEEMVMTKLAQASQQDQDLFWNLQDCHLYGGKKTAFGIWQTNAIATGENDAANTMNGIYLLACRFNHSCKPNVNRCWIEELQAEVFHATQDISKGEELLIYYIDPKGMFTERQSLLKESFNFTCRCEACSLQGDDRKASDALRKEYQELDSVVLLARSDPDRALEAVFRILEIIQTEFDGDPQMAQRAFHDGFQVALLSGDIELASEMMERTIEAKTIAEGNHAEIARLQRYAKDPRSHPLLSGGRKADDWPDITCMQCSPDDGPASTKRMMFRCDCGVPNCEPSACDVATPALRSALESGQMIGSPSAVAVDLCSLD